MKIGIPYARVEFDGDQAVEVCPECGERCPMQTDRVGERTTATYADHYAAEHDQKG